METIEKLVCFYFNLLFTTKYCLFVCLFKIVIYTQLFHNLITVVPNLFIPYLQPLKG